MNSATHHRLTFVLMLILMLAATWLRLWRLPEVPPGLWYDEAYNAMDALWMLEAHSPQVFFVGNNGREPMLHYLGALSMAIQGATPYTFRLVSALVGIITVPLLYRWLVTLFADDPNRRWLALIASTGFAFSFWHTVISRSGYRASLFPLFVILSAYLFWRGWQARSPLYFASAGVTLGLSQYTYTSARLLPLVFGFFALAWTILAERHGTYPLQRRTLWLGLLAMALVSLIVFLPLGLFFMRHPATFAYRAGSVSIFHPYFRGISLSGHLLEAFSVFINGSDPNWRHNLVGRPGFDWLSVAGFWVGLALTVRRFRRTTYLFLLVGLFVLWLPAPLSFPAVHTLRLSGLLPFYYIFVAVGLLSVGRWITRQLTTFRIIRWRPAFLLTPLLVFVTAFVISGGSTAYDYFVRWANDPMVYSYFEGPLVDLVQHLVVESRTTDVLLPFRTYVHPATRFLLHDEFHETDTLPAATRGRPAVLVTTPETPASSAYVLLTRDASGRGVIYIPPLPLSSKSDIPESTGQILPFLNPYTTETTAHLFPLKSTQPLLSSLSDWQLLNTVDYDLGHQIRLLGYQVWPDRVQPGQPLALNLYWLGLIDQPIEYKTFLHLVNSRGEPITEGDGHFLSDEYRWRKGGGIPDQYTLWVGPETRSGPYLVRMGLFNPRTGKRVPIYNAAGELLGDQMFLGLFYVAQGEADPRLPQTPLQAGLSDHIQLLGYSLTLPERETSSLQVQIHWQATGKVNGNYTIFVQLLNAQDQLITGWDSQPLAGQYPTSHWQPGEVVVDVFELPLPEDLPPDEYRLVTGMYDFATGQRLPATGSDGQPLPGDMIVLLQTRMMDRGQ